MCPYLTKQNVAAIDINGESVSHPEGSVLSDWELSDFIRDKIKEGSAHYRERYEPLTDHEAHSYRVKATAAQGSRQIDGERVDPPFDDYVGLHPTEICNRLRDATLMVVGQTRKFEKAGLNRSQIVEFVSPAEHAPWDGYDALGVTEILAKFAVNPDSFVSDAVAYERVHKNREPIVTYDREIYENASTPTKVPVPPAAVTA